MAKILITAFGPYDSWRANSSWLAMQELTRDLPDALDVTTRLYPVDFDEAFVRLEKDMQAAFDVAIHLGQSAGSGIISLEAFGVNVRRDLNQPGYEARFLVADGPPAYRSSLPLDDWATMIRGAGIPADISYHAGSFLCNATLYWSHYLAQQQGLSTVSAFIHLPLDTSQALENPRDLPSLPAKTSARAIRLLLESLHAATGKDEAQ